MYVFSIMYYHNFKIKKLFFFFYYISKLDVIVRKWHSLNDSSHKMLKVKFVLFIIQVCVFIHWSISQVFFNTFAFTFGKLAQYTYRFFFLYINVWLMNFFFNWSFNKRGFHDISAIFWWQMYIHECNKIFGRHGGKFF